LEIYKRSVTTITLGAQEHPAECLLEGQTPQFERIMILRVETGIQTCFQEGSTGFKTGTKALYQGNISFHAKNMDLICLETKV
jgi:hypothetical protein